MLCNNYDYHLHMTGEKLRHRKIPKNQINFMSHDYPTSPNTTALYKLPATLTFLIPFL